MSQGLGILTRHLGTAEVMKCDSVLLVGSYCYVNGVHPNDGDGLQAILDTIQPDETYHCIIKEEDGKFKFYFEDKYWECDAGNNWTRIEKSGCRLAGRADGT